MANAETSCPQPLPNGDMLFSKALNGHSTGLRNGLEKRVRINCVQIGLIGMYVTETNACIVLLAPILCIVYRVHRSSKEESLFRLSKLWFLDMNKYGI